MKQEKIYGFEREFLTLLICYDIKYLKCNECRNISTLIIPKLK